MTSTVGDPAAEREPDNVTPDPCPIGDPDCETGDDGSCHDGCTPAELPDTDIRSALAGDLDRMGLMPEPLDWSAYKPCPSCGVQTGAPCVILGGYNPSTPHPDRERIAVEPERRTVSLEVLTDELVAEMGITPGYGRVGVVLRIDGELCDIPITDGPWHRRSAPAKLIGLLREAESIASSVINPELSAELLMPTPDVLAALDGRPDATFWTAPVEIRAEHIQAGWLLVGYSGPDVEEQVTGKERHCAASDCPWPGDCTALTVGDDEPQHFADWTQLFVRIPCSVTQ